MPIRVFVMDVDGTMTDGKIYMGKDGEVFKAFDIHDGYGIHEILPGNGVKTVILTGRKSAIVENRARELEVDYVFQGIKDKAKVLEELCALENCTLNEIAYIGDDIIDLKAMRLCGSKGCPKNAVAEVIKVCDYVSTLNGGEGAVRDYIEWLKKNNMFQ